MLQITDLFFNLLILSSFYFILLVAKISVSCFSQEQYD